MTDRALWWRALARIATPPLTALAERRLRTAMPIETRPGHPEAREQFTHLEALGQTLAGVAPWLDAEGLEGEEAAARARLVEAAREAIDAATDPASPDYCNYTEGYQPVVDAAFLAHGLLRGWRTLWEPLPDRVKANVIAALRATRERRPWYNNWLLFAAMVEAFLHDAGAGWDPMRVDFAIKKHLEWYLGDGHYGDGHEFHWDYYNSFVIQPMLVTVLEHLGHHQASEWAPFVETTRRRMIRYAAVQERLIAPDGTFPPIGRSLVYRFGAFQALGEVARRGWLPAEIQPAQVRCALTAVLRRLIDAPGTFDAEGWLTIGLAGHQPALGEAYISTGSTYLCTVGFLPLGLPPSAPFWSDPPAPWTSQRIWGGENLPADHALKKA